ALGRPVVAVLAVRVGRSAVATRGATAAAATTTARNEQRGTALAHDRGTTATPRGLAAATATAEAAVPAADAAAALSGAGDEDGQRPGRDRHPRRDLRARAAHA